VSPPPAGGRHTGPPDGGPARRLPARPARMCGGVWRPGERGVCAARTRRGRSHVVAPPGRRHNGVPRAGPDHHPHRERPCPHQAPVPLRPRQPDTLRSPFGAVRGRAGRGPYQGRGARVAYSPGKRQSLHHGRAHTVASTSRSRYSRARRGIRRARNRREPAGSHATARCPRGPGGRLDQRARAGGGRRGPGGRPRGDGGGDRRARPARHGERHPRPGRHERPGLGGQGTARPGPDPHHRGRLPPAEIRHHHVRQHGVPLPVARPRGRQSGPRPHPAGRHGGPTGARMTTTTARAEGSAPELLGSLAADRATGALTTRYGVLYLSAGHVVHVESGYSPDLGDLLTRSGAVTPDGWWEAVEYAGAGHRVGRRLIDSGCLTTGALELFHLGALFDAAYFALAPDGSAPRFRAGVAHWFGAVRPVPVASVLRASRRRRDLLHRIWPDPAVDTVPLTRLPAADPAGLPPRRGRTLALVDGARTAAQIASALACRTFHTLVELRRLAADGLVTPAPPP